MANNTEDPVSLKSDENGSTVEQSIGENMVINEPISKTKAFVKLVLTCVGMIGYSCLFRNAYFESPESVNIRVWEDLYGRGLFFFLTSAASYIYYSRQNENISFFELEPKLRGMFALRMASSCLSYGFLALSFTHSS